MLLLVTDSNSFKGGIIITETKKMRNTPQRKLVLKIVNESLDHPTAETVYQRARDIDPTISMGTVYRNLSILSQLGEILDLPMPTGPNHYDYKQKPHAHFYCKKCGNVIDVPMCQLIEKINFEELLPHCQVDGCGIVFTGTCSNCCDKNSK